MALTRALAGADLIKSPFDSYCDSNTVINARHRITQLNGSTAVTGISAGNNYITDGWYVGCTGGPTVSGQQIAAPFSTRPDLIYGLKMAVTSGAALSSTGLIKITQPIEGVRLTNTPTGAATLSAYVVGVTLHSNISLTGTIALRNTSTRSYVSQFTLVANTDTFVSVVIPADTVGTWTFSTTAAAYLDFCFGSGSTYQTTANAWQTGVYLATSSVTNIGATTGNYVIMSDAIMLPILDASIPANVYIPQERLPFFERWDDDELRSCQRYFATSLGAGEYALYGAPNNTYGASYRVALPVTMRSTPTLSLNTLATNALASTALLTICQNFFIYEIVASSSTNAEWGFSWTASCLM